MKNEEMKKEEKYTNQFGRNRGQWTKFDRIADFYGVSHLCDGHEPRFLSLNPKYEMSTNQDMEMFERIHKGIESENITDYIKRFEFSKDINAFLILANYRYHKIKSEIE